MRSSVPLAMVAIACAAVVAMTVVIACGSKPPTVPANPEAGDCLAERMKEIGACIKDNATKETIDACRKTKVRDCTDGGMAITTSEGGV